MVKKILKILWMIVVAVTLLLIAAGLLIQLPAVQTRIADIVVEKLDDKIDADISIGKIHFRPFKTLMLKNVLIIDRNPVNDALDSTKTPVDTFFRAEYIIARLSLEGLLTNEGLYFNSATISNAQMNLVLENKPADADGDRTTDNLSRIFRLKKPQGPKEKNDREIFHIKNVSIEDMGFSMKDYDDKKSPYHGGINWNDLDVKDINIEASGLRFKGGVMYGTAHKVSFREKSGFTAEKISGEVKVGNGKTIIEDLRIKDEHSRLEFNTFMMSYANSRVFKYFTDEVRLDADIIPSRLSLQTLAYFIPAIGGSDNEMRVFGQVSGPVSDLILKGLNISLNNGIFSGTLDGGISGIPDLSQTSLDMTLGKFQFTTAGLDDFIGGWIPKGGPRLDGFAPKVVLNMDAQAYGRLNDLTVNTQITSASGDAYANVHLDNLLTPEAGLGISGRASTEDLDLRHIVKGVPVGPVTLSTQFEARLGKDPEINVDTIKIARLNFNNYDYSGITALGTFRQGVASGGLLIHDPNLYLFINGNYSSSEKTEQSRLSLNGTIANADLNALNLDKRGKSNVSFSIKGEAISTAEKDLMSTLMINSLEMENNGGKYDIGDIQINYDIDKIHKMRLRSGFADALYEGSAPVTEFINDLTDITAREQMPSLFSDPSYEWKGDSYTFSLLTHNTADLMAFAAPGIFINENTEVKMTIGSEGMMEASLKSRRIAKGDNYLKDVIAVFSNADSTLTGLVDVSEIELAKMKINDNRLNIRASDDNIGVSYSYDNHSNLENRGEIVLDGNLSREEDVLGAEVSILPSTVYLNGDRWIIHQSRIGLKNKTAGIEGFAVSSGEQKLWIDGGISEESDTLTLGLERFDISLLNNIMKSDLGLKGVTSGQVSLLSPRKSGEMLVDLICDSTYIGGEPLGVLTVGCTKNEALNSYDISLKNELDGKQNIEVDARISPSSRYLTAEAVLDSMQIKYAEPFLTDVFSEMDGLMSGKINAEGPLNMLDISSSGTRLDKALLKVAFTNVPYYAEGGFHIDNNGVYFDKIAIRDRFTGTGTVEGSINWDRFKDMSFDTRIKVNAIEGVNIPEEGNQGFYGNLFASGNVSITGPGESMLLSVDAVTAKNGNLHIPMSNAATADATTNLLRFKEPAKEEEIDQYEALRADLSRTHKKESAFNVSLRVDASPNVNVFVELDKSGGNMLTGTGNGLIELEIGKDLFNINGDYTLTGGQYNFSALGLVSKIFEIEDGSTINFNGDIMQSNLDIDAVYTCKAMLSNLLSEVNSVDTRRDVNCKIEITGKLSNPEIGFGIDVPDLNPMIKSRVESALSTEDKVQKQMLSLLLTNSFLPDEQSGIVNNTSMLYSNFSEAMANQLNNILHKLDIPLDLGLNYQPTVQGTDLFDVAVSTKLFNNRVVVNGNIGNKQTTIGGTQNDVVGDFDMEIKINRSGTLRVDLFSHSADVYSNYLDNTQRNGVGLTYQTEFDSIRNVIRYVFSDKEEKEKIKIAEEESIINADKVVLKITRDDYSKTGKDDRE